MWKKRNPERGCEKSEWEKRERRDNKVSSAVRKISERRWLKKIGEGDRDGRRPAAREEERRRDFFVHELNGGTAAEDEHVGGRR